MQGLVFAVVVGLGLYATDRWAVKRQAVYPMTLTAASIWSFLAIRGTRITSNMNGPYTVTYPYLGYVWLFLALASMLALVAHYLWGLPSTGHDEEIDADPTASGPESTTTD